MTVIALVPYLFMLIGAVLYASPLPPKLQELGRQAFLAGAIGVCVSQSGLTARIG